MEYVTIVILLWIAFSLHDIASCQCELVDKKRIYETIKRINRSDKAE